MEHPNEKYSKFNKAFRAYCQQQTNAKKYKINALLNLYHKAYDPCFQAYNNYTRHPTYQQMFDFLIFAIAFEKNKYSLKTTKKQEWLAATGLDRNVCFKILRDLDIKPISFDNAVYHVNMNKEHYIDQSPSDTYDEEDSTSSNITMASEISSFLMNESNTPAALP